MLGLLLKDFYVVSRRAKLIFFLYLFGTIMSGGSMGSIFIILGAMMPLTAMAYDERSKWDELAALMPYSPKDRAFSKFMLGYCSILSTSLLAFIGTFTSKIFAPSSSVTFVEVLLISGISLIYLAVALPLQIKYGAEQGRMILLAATATLIGIYMITMTPTFEQFSSETLLLIIWGIAIVLNIISLRLSTIFLETKVRR